MMTSEETFGKTTFDYWTGKWQKKDLTWHRTEVSLWLIKYFHRFQFDNLTNPPRAFVPMCGKSLDMKWLAEKGLHVTGVELSDIACKEFFDDLQLPYELQHDEGIPAYKCKTLPIVIYSCNFFEFPKFKKEKFDLVWDRGSFVALVAEDWPKYVEILKDLYAEKFYHMIESFNYNQEEHNSFPKSLTMEQVQSLIGDEYTLELLEKFRCEQEMVQRLNVKFSFICLAAYLVTRK